MPRLTVGRTETLVRVFSAADQPLELVPTPTVAVVSGSGATLPTIVPVRRVDLPHAWTLTFTPAHTAQVDTLRVSVVDATMGLIDSFPVDVVSSRILDLAELRAMQDIGDSDRYPLPALAAARDWVEGRIESCVGSSFCELALAESHSHRTPIFVRALHPRRLLGVTEGDDVIDPSTWAIDPNGLVTPAATPRSTVHLRYSAGFSTEPPADITTAALLATRARVLAGGASGIPDRARGMSNEFGNITLSVAGVNAPTGFPDADATILRWRDRFRHIGVG